MQLKNLEMKLKEGNDVPFSNVSRLISIYLEDLKGFECKKISNDTALFYFIPWDVSMQIIVTGAFLKNQIANSVRVTIESENNEKSTELLSDLSYLIEKIGYE